MAETDFRYDVFLSHNGKDKPAVEQIARLLRDEYNLKAWLDKWHLVPGDPWQEGLEEALDECQTFAVFLGPSGIGPWENEEMRSAISDRVQDKNRRVIPVLLPGAPDNRDLDLPRFLKRTTWVDFRLGLDDEEALYRLYCGITGQPPGDRGPSISSKIPTMADWHLAHPYPMPPNFTGRAAELKILDDWLVDDKDRLFILRALGGFGKSALAWQWINTHVNPAEWTKLVWWSFYEGDASFQHFIEETLKYLKLEVPQGQRPQVDELLKAMQSQKILLIMDGFERALRAYSSMNAGYQGDEPKVEDNQLDCVNINAEIFLKNVCSLPNVKGKVLITTRLTPRAVKPRGEFMLGCREEVLASMQKADAVEFFHKQKIKGTHAEIEAACAPYGYHSLSLRLLTGRIAKDFENPHDIIVAQKFKIDGDLKQQKHYVLEVSYNNLPPHEQKLLRTIACFRSTVELNTLQAIAEDKDILDNDLQDLRERGLLHFDDKNKKFDLHPIVRRYAYERLTIPDRTAIHIRLCNYFAAIDVPAKPKAIDDLASVIELFHHLVKASQFDEAMDIYYRRLKESIYYQFGANQTAIELLSALFPDGENQLPHLERDDAQAWTLNEIANVYSACGQPRRAIMYFETNNSLQELGISNPRSFSVNEWKRDLARGLGNMALQQLTLGAIREAEVNLRRAIRLESEIDINESEFEQACDKKELGRLLSYRGEWQDARRELEKAQIELDKHGMNSFIAGVRADYSLRAILMRRDLAMTETNYHKSAIDFALHSLELAEYISQKAYPFERDFVRGHWLLGAAYRLNGQLDLTEYHLNEALTRDRSVSLVDLESDILLDISRLRYDQKNYEEAKSLAEEALLITERCGYVLQGADVNLFLAQYALEQEKDKAKAKEYAETALKLAYCDGPPYYYKVAYHEAERMLELLKD